MAAFAPTAAWPSEPQPALARAVWFLVLVCSAAALWLGIDARRLWLPVGAWGLSMLAVWHGARGFVRGALRWHEGAWAFAASQSPDSYTVIRQLESVMPSPWGQLWRADDRWLWLPAPTRTADAATRERWRAMQRALVAHRGSASLPLQHG
jgi:hypothetical protein